jgi:hypothetical protein
MSKINSFVKQFIAAVQGDDAEVQAQKAFRSADSALKVQIASLNGDVIKLEDDVEAAKEALNAARINGGKVISDRNYYVEQLVAAKNTLTQREKSLKDHNAKLEFLTETLASLSA